MSDQSGFGSGDLRSILGLPEDQFTEFEFYRVYKCLSYILLGCYIWDFIITFNMELSVLTRRRRVGLNFVPYFLTKYSLLATTIPNIMLVHSSSQVDCQAVVLIIIIMAATTQVFSQIMFSIRAWSLWNYDKRVLAVLLAVWLPHSALSYMVVIGYKANWYIDIFAVGGFCSLEKYSKFAVPSYALLLAVDLTVTALTLLRLFALRKESRSRFTDTLARDLLMYLTVCMVPCIAGIVIVVVVNSIALRSAFYIVTTQVHATFSCRAFINSTNLAEQLPANLRLKVHNERLDPQTLRRIAGHFGMQADMEANPHSRSNSTTRDLEKGYRHRDGPKQALTDGMSKFKIRKNKRDAAPKDLTITVTKKKTRVDDGEPFDQDGPGAFERSRSDASPVSVNTFASHQRDFGLTGRRGGRKDVRSESETAPSYFPQVATTEPGFHSTERRHLSGEEESIRDSIFSQTGSAVVYGSNRHRGAGADDNASSSDSEVMVITPRAQGGPAVVVTGSTDPSSPSNSQSSDSPEREGRGGRPPARRRSSPYGQSSSRWNYGRRGSGQRTGVWESNPTGPGSLGHDQDSESSGPEWETNPTVYFPPLSSASRSNGSSRRNSAGRGLATGAEGGPSQRTSDGGHLPPPLPSHSEHGHSPSSAGGGRPGNPALQVMTVVETTQVTEEYDDFYPTLSFGGGLSDGHGSAAEHGGQSPAGSNDQPARRIRVPRVRGQPRSDSGHPSSASP